MIEQYSTVQSKYHRVLRSPMKYWHASNLLQLGGNPIPVAASEKMHPHIIQQSQSDLSVPAGLIGVKPTCRTDGNANSPGKPSPSKVQRLETSKATASQKATDGPG